MNVSNVSLMNHYGVQSATNLHRNKNNREAVTSFGMKTPSGSGVIKHTARSFFAAVSIAIASLSAASCDKISSIIEELSNTQETEQEPWQDPGLTADNPITKMIEGGDKQSEPVFPELKDFIPEFNIQNDSGKPVQEIFLENMKKYADENRLTLETNGEDGNIVTCTLYKRNLKKFSATCDSNNITLTECSIVSRTPTSIEQRITTYNSYGNKVSLPKYSIVDSEKKENTTIYHECTSDGRNVITAEIQPDNFNSNGLVTLIKNCACTNTGTIAFETSSEGNYTVYTLNKNKKLTVYVPTNDGDGSPVKIKCAGENEPDVFIRCLWEVFDRINQQ